MKSLFAKVILMFLFCMICAGFKDGLLAYDPLNGDSRGESVNDPEELGKLGIKILKKLDVDNKQEFLQQMFSYNEVLECGSEYISLDQDTFNRKREDFYSDLIASAEEYKLDWKEIQYKDFKYKLKGINKDPFRSLKGILFFKHKNSSYGIIVHGGKIDDCYKIGGFIDLCHMKEEIIENYIHDCDVKSTNIGEKEARRVAMNCASTVAQLVATYYYEHNKSESAKRKISNLSCGYGGVIKLSEDRSDNIKMPKDCKCRIDDNDVIVTHKEHYVPIKMSPQVGGTNGVFTINQDRSFKESFTA